MLKNNERIKIVYGKKEVDQIELFAKSKKTD